MEELPGDAGGIGIFGRTPGTNLFPDQIDQTGLIFGIGVFDRIQGSLGPLGQRNRLNDGNERPAIGDDLGIVQLPLVICTVMKPGFLVGIIEDGIVRSHDARITFVKILAG